MNMATEHLIAEDFTPARLRALGTRDRAAYAAATPWPHVVVNDLFSRAVLEELVGELDAIRPSALLHHATSRTVKNEFAEIRDVGPMMQAFQQAMDGAPFTAYLEAVTGITGLVADPTRLLAGLHETPVGGFTKVHTDFSRHPKTDLHHRVNVLLYMNPEWHEEWGGQLELWPSDMHGDPTVVQPTLGTLVVFATNDDSKHGLPRPVTCPEGTTRRSLAFYFYSKERHGDKLTAPHSAYYARPAESPRDVDSPLKERVLELLPRRLVASAYRIKARIGRG